MGKDKILITGAAGQLGGVLTDALVDAYSEKQVILSDVRPIDHSLKYFSLDVTDRRALAALVKREEITQIYHLAAILSAKGETMPLTTQRVNIDGLINVLEVARELQLDKVFCPSSIAVFGEGAHRNPAGQFEPLIPSTVYGMTKASGELWCKYYWDRYQVDVRSLRYPGVIGYQTMPGGGTTDYAVDIFHAAVKGAPFQCFLAEDAGLPMIYMEDAIRATLELMNAPASELRIRTSYNLQGFSLEPQELAEAIRSEMPDFEITYQPDERQAIAESWPSSIDDQFAREDWGWKPKYDLESMTRDMLSQLSKTSNAPI